MALSLAENYNGIALLNGEYEVTEGMEVRGTGHVVQVPVQGLEGRIVDPIGRPLDAQGPIQSLKFRPVEREAPAIIDRDAVEASAANRLAGHQMRRLPHRQGAARTDHRKSGRPEKLRWPSIPSSTSAAAMFVAFMWPSARKDQYRKKRNGRISTSRCAFLYDGGLCRGFRSCADAISCTLCRVRYGRACYGRGRRRAHRI